MEDIKTLTTAELIPWCINTILTFSENGGREMTKKQYMHVISSVYNVLTHVHDDPVHGFGARFATFLHGEVEQLLKAHCTAKRAELTNFSGERLLAKFIAEWDRFTFQCTVLDGLFKYFNDHFWNKVQSNSPNHVPLKIHQLALSMWRDNVVIHDGLQEQLFSAALFLLQQERDGEQINQGLVKSLTQCLVALGLQEVIRNGVPTPDLSVYNLFESQIIQATCDYYSAESAKFLADNPVTEYMKRAVLRIEQELRRIENCLHSSSEQAIIKTCDKLFVEERLDVLKGEFVHLLEDLKSEDIRRLYLLLGRFEDEGRLPALQHQLRDYVHQQGQAALEANVEEALKQPDKYVNLLLEVYGRYSKLVKEAFDSHPLFTKALDDGCTAFVNKNAVTIKARKKELSAELIAKYCDMLLKGSSKTHMDEHELESMLDQIIVVFKFLEDKDVFQQFYSNNLAKRLVSKKSASDDAESSMISRLKGECGFEYVSRLQRMFSDMTVNKDLNASFQEHLVAVSASAPFDCSFLVLTSGSWPFKQPHEMELPKALHEANDKFRVFYTHKHQGRKLMWMWKLSHGELKTKFLKSSHTLSASAYQMAVLLNYNESEEYSLSELAANTKLPTDLLRGVMETLCKCKLLVLEGERYQLNPKCKFKSTRCNINMPIKMEKEKESQETQQEVVEERKLVLQALIVRIMKTRKKLAHGELLAETMSQVQSRFKPEVKMIKKQVDALIEKEYLERDGAEYKYLA